MLWLQVDTSRSLLLSIQRSELPNRNIHCALCRLHTKDLEKLVQYTKLPIGSCLVKPVMTKRLWYNYCRWCWKRVSSSTVVWLKVAVSFRRHHHCLFEKGDRWKGRTMTMLQGRWSSNPSRWQVRLKVTKFKWAHDCTCHRIVSKSGLSGWWSTNDILWILNFGGKKGLDETNLCVVLLWFVRAF